jgi:Secretion system C-terminal sorting domain
MKLLNCVAIVFLFGVTFTALDAQWSNDPSVNTPVPGATMVSSSAIVGDGAGGAFIAWSTETSDDNVYAQHLDASGTATWGSGITICDSTGDQINVQITADGAGGAIVVWEDNRPTEFSTTGIYAQRVNSSGQVQWTAGGIDVSAPDLIGNQEAQVLSDGSGGAFISWDGAFGGYAAHVNSAGARQWLDTLYTQDITSDKIISDGAGGLIATWCDERPYYRTFDINNLEDIYAQRINAGGQELWGSGGVLVCGAPQLQTSPTLVTDGSNGAIICWSDFRNDTTILIYSQRVDGSGHRMWINGSDSNGVALCQSTETQDYASAASDGAAGAIVTWDDDRDNIYAQRISGAGALLWGSSAATVASSVNFAPQSYPELTSDGSGGAILAWEDNRNNGSDLTDVYAQRINSDGQAQWTANGVAVSTAKHEQANPTLVSNGNSGAIILWTDWRNYSNNNSGGDLYVQLVSGGGSLSSVRTSSSQNPVAYALSQNYPNPFNPATMIQFSVAHAGVVTLKVYDMLGREVATLVNQQLAPSTYSVTWNASNFASGVYFYRLQAGNFVEIKKLMLMK